MFPSSTPLLSCTSRPFQSCPVVLKKPAVQRPVHYNGQKNIPFINMICSIIPANTCYIYIYIFECSDCKTKGSRPLPNLQGRTPLDLSAPGLSKSRTSVESNSLASSEPPMISSLWASKRTAAQALPSDRRAKLSGRNGRKPFFVRSFGFERKAAAKKRSVFRKRCGANTCIYGCYMHLPTEAYGPEPVLLSCGCKVPFHPGCEGHFTLQ